MEVESPLDSQRQVGENPYSQDPAIDQSNYGDPYDDQIKLLKDIKYELIRIANTSEAQRERPREARMKFPILGNTTRLRVELLIFTSDAACVVSLMAGSIVLDVFNLGAADTKIIPYPMLLQEGIDYSLIFTAGTPANQDGFVVGYPEPVATQ